MALARHLHVVTVLALLGAMPGTSVAQPSPNPEPGGGQALGTPSERKAKAKQLGDEAGRKYNLGQFDAALDLYTKAYDTYPAAGLLFNLGQCHRSLGNHERAVFFYEGYLREKPKAPNRDLVEELLTEERALLARQRAEEAERARLAEEQKRLAEEEERRRAEEQRLAEEERRRQEEEQRRSALLTPGLGDGAAVGGASTGAAQDTSIFRRWWFWTAVGVGVAATAGTIIYLGSRGDEALPAGTLGTLDGRDD